MTVEDSETRLRKCDRGAWRAPAQCEKTESETAAPVPVTEWRTIWNALLVTAAWLNAASTPIKMMIETNSIFTRR